jgi:hypothetical protein
MSDQDLPKPADQARGAAICNAVERADKKTDIIPLIALRVR